MSIHELPRTPRKKTGGILEKMVMHGVDGDGMDSESKSEDRAENMTPEWTSNRLRYLDDVAMTKRSTGNIDAVKRHISKMKELGHPVPADLARQYDNGD